MVSDICVPNPTAQLTAKLRYQTACAASPCGHTEYILNFANLTLAKPQFKNPINLFYCTCLSSASLFNIVGSFPFKVWQINQTRRIRDLMGGKAKNLVFLYLKKLQNANILLN
jgi:hypothetical protein